ERLCRQRGVLLILDEVQTGIGRCGALLAEELYGVRADIVTLGKGLGAGVPLSALLARGNACCFEPGDQLGTHHGNALMTAAGLAVLNTVLEPGFLEQVREQGTHLRDGLARVARRYGHGPLRGQGLFWGLPLIGQRAPAVVRAAFGEGLLINAPQPHCLRFSPALTVSRANVDEMLRRLERALARVANRHEEVA
ncbi:aminotransferase class III-fold pyridoxal phosphate-dependent enzyme, partial [Pseudomonas aeruginosa]|nr:aminotransferase class III-fold pyridoxal phosphate-dependent enzyme [Pseudomonas aeruginosa]